MEYIAGCFTGLALGCAFIGELYGLITFTALATIVTIIAIIKDNKK